MNHQNYQQQSPQQIPLITVSGQLNEFLFHGNLCNQIDSDLARESIDWKRNIYDVTPLPVYIEARLVNLDTRKHWLWDFFTKDNFWLMNKSNYNNNHKTQQTQIAASTISPDTSYRVRQLNASNLKRHHSFNSQQNVNPNNPSINTHSPNISATKTTGSVWSPHSKLIKGNQMTNESLPINRSSPIEQTITINYPYLFRMLAKQHCLNDDARVLLNSYWLDSNFDLESYNSQVRDNLIEWFQKNLIITAGHHQIGLNQDFHIDFLVVIVVRNHINSIGSMSHMAQQNQQQQQQQQKKQKSSEQLLNLSNLVTKNSGINSIGKKKNNKADRNNFVKQSYQLSSSMSSLNTTGPTRLTHHQLADQIRNDLMVCFQLFRQNHSSNGTLEMTGIPSTNTPIATQLLERIVIFDSTSNSSENPTSNTSSHHNQQTTTSTNPIITSTARTFTAFSNFSAGSIKITPSSMISMSPTRSSSKAKNSSSSSPTLPSSGLLQSPPILNYSQFIIRIRKLLLEHYTRKIDCLEKLIRQIRELRNEPTWDYFGFFLIQEELAFAYESLGLYSKALIQYDELDALFSQLVLNASNHGGFNAPMWLKKRLMQNDLSIDDLNEDVSSNQTPSDLAVPYTRIRHMSNSQTKPPSYHRGQNAWTGLCLCNPESIANLRLSIVRSVLFDQNIDNYDDLDQRSSPSDGLMSDPLGVLDSQQQTTNEDQINQGISLLDFRNYMYARQCHLLCLLNKPWELASRALPFLQNAVAELNMLEISITPGGIACWVFLSVLEILHKCERYHDSSQLDSYSYHTVGLWSYARDNLIELGKICRLLPDFISNSDPSEHLHRMVELVAGMGADPHIRPSTSSNNDDNWMSPQERLKDALSSPESFLRHYLEITELTMGTYKHIGYIRFARSIGKQLAELYLKLNKPQQALPFLLDLYHMFQIEHWPILRQQNCQLLAKCLEKLYFSITNEGEIEDITCNFSPEPIVRSAFWTYLLLLLKPVQGMEKFSRNHENERNQYLASMFALIDRYASKLDSNESSLLTIHNSHSDLLHDGCIIETRSNAAPSSNDTNSNSSGSNSNIHYGYESEKSFMPSHQQHANSLNSSENVDWWRTGRCHCCHQDQLHFITIESAQISCDSPLHNSSDMAPRKDLSFIAGSVLKLKLKLSSQLDLKLKLNRIIITLQCHWNDPMLLTHNKNNDNQSEMHQAYSTCKMACFESYYIKKPLSSGIKCINEESLLKRLNGSYRDDWWDGYHKFMSQMPISLLNQRLSNDDYCKYFRYISAPYKFENVEKKESECLEMNYGINEYELWFQSPSNLQSEAMQHLSDSNNKFNLNQLWLNLDQLILFCQYQNDEQDPVRSMQFVLQEDFSEKYSNNCFRLVRCPPSIELVPKFTNEKSNMCFVGIEQSVLLRINSGTNKLPKGFHCTLKIDQVISKDAKNLEDDPDGHLIKVSLHQNDGSEVHSLCLDHQLEPFETYQICLQLRSSYSKYKTLKIQKNNSNRIGMNNRTDSRIDQYEFKLSLSWNGQEDSSANCYFTLSDPFQLQPTVHTASPKIKLLQIQIVPSQRLQSNIELWFQYPQLRPYDSSQTEHFKLIGIDGDSSNEEYSPKLMANSRLNFVWSLDKITKFVKLDLHLKFRTLVGGNLWLSTVMMPYRIIIVYNCQTRYTIRQSIEPLIKQSGKNSEIIRNGNPCLLRVKIERIIPTIKMEKIPDEIIMYELICDPQSWSFVAVDPTFLNGQTSQRTVDNDNISEDCTITNEDNNNQKFNATMASSIDCRIVKFSGTINNNNNNDNNCSNNKNAIGIDDNADSNHSGAGGGQVFETAFQVLPLTVGYVPMPAVRISLYRSNDQTMIETMNDSNYNNQQQQQQQHQQNESGRMTPLFNNNNSKITTSNAIESLSAMLSENLSGKNWSKYLSPSNNSSNNNNKNTNTNISDINNDKHHQQAQQSLSSSINNSNNFRSARLEPFEPGQVYNFNRSSQVYIMPSLNSEMNNN